MSLAELGSRAEILDASWRPPRRQLEAREAAYGEETWAIVERAVLLRAIDPLWVEHLTELDDFRRGVGLRGYGGTDPLVEFKREAFKLYEELRGFIRHQVASTIFRVNVQRRVAAPPSRPHDADADRPEQLARSLKGAGSRTRRCRAAGRRGRVCAAIGGRRRQRHLVERRARPSTRAAARARPGVTPRRRCACQRGDETVGVTLRGRRAAAAARRMASALGRNDPCCCGSGMKFKRCHGSLTRRRPGERHGPAQPDVGCLRPAGSRSRWRSRRRGPRT